MLKKYKLKKDSSPENNIEIYKSLDKNLNILKREFKDCPDIKLQIVQTRDGLRSCVVFTGELIDKGLVQRDVIKVLMESDSKTILGLKNKNVFPVTYSVNIYTIEAVIDEVLRGNTVVFVDGLEFAVSCELKKFDKRAIDEPVTEKAIKVLNVGIDEAVDDKVLVTYTLPVIQPEGGGGGGGGVGGGGGGGAGGGGTRTESYKTEAYLLREARDFVRLESPTQLEGGKIQNTLIGRDLAEKGNITAYMEIFERDISNPVQAWVIIVDGKANELIEKGTQFKNKPKLGLYINNIIDGNSKSGYCPDETISSF